MFPKPNSFAWALTIAILVVGCDYKSPHSDPDRSSLATELSLDISGGAVLSEFADPNHLVLAQPESGDEHLSAFESMAKELQANTLLSVLTQDVSGSAVESLNQNSTLKMEIAHDSRWVRDFLPWEANRSDGSRFLLKTEYLPISPLRPYDDRAPFAFASKLSVPLVTVPLVMDGGSFTTNGSGIALVSTIIERQNAFWNYSRTEIEEILQKYFGITDCLFVDPLDGEPTGHVDMFATFIGTDRLLIGTYDSRVDPVNAERLDEIARQAAQLHTHGKKLTVERITMPEHSDGVWRTFINFVFVGPKVFVPTYPDELALESRQAVTQIRKLIPNRKVVAVDCSKLVTRGGALHCISRCYTSELAKTAKVNLTRDTPIPSTPVAASTLRTTWTADKIAFGLSSRRIATMWTLSTQSSPPIQELTKLLLDRRSHPDNAVRRDAAFLLRQTRAKLSTEDYAVMLSDPSFQVRWFTMAMIGDLGLEGMPVLKSLVDKVPNRIISFCLRLNPRFSAELIPFLESGLVHRDPQIRIWTFETLAELGEKHPDMLAVVKEVASKEKDKDVRSVCSDLKLIEP